MASGNWQKCCATTLEWEGGNDDDLHDPGGRTSRGILQREYGVWRQAHPGLPADVWVAPQATIVAIYYEKYWLPVYGDVWPAGLDLVVYDAGVNSGFGKALAWSRATLGAVAASLPQLAEMGQHVNDRVSFVKRFQARRLSFLEALRTWQYFGRGWARRVAGIEAQALKMVAASSGVPSDTVLKPEGVKAAQKSKAAGGASVATTGGVGAHTGQVDWTSWLDLALGVGLLILGVALIIYLVHVWHTQSERSSALSEALK